MLSRKSLGVAGAALLGTVALMGTNPANAKIIVGGTGTHGDVKIAREALTDTTATTNTVDSVKYYYVADANEILDVQATTGLAASGSLTVYLRFNLENMIFGAAISGTPVTGGGIGDDFVVLSYASGGANENRTLDVGTLGVLPDKAGSVSVEAYVSAVDALRQTNPISSKPQRADNAVMVIDGVEDKGKSGGAVAEVSTGFTKFVDGTSTKLTAQIGMLNIAHATGVVDRSSAVVDTLDDLLSSTTPVTITYKGDFSEHTYALNDAANCAGNAIASSLNTAKTELTPTTQPDGSTASVSQYLCVTVADDNTKSLTTAPFMATVEYGKLADAAFPRADQTVTVGSIGRNGTTYRIPFITTNSRFKQRFTFVNRGSTDAGYVVGEFHAKDGVTASAGAMASGTLAAGEQTVLMASDIVSISGGTRAAASVAIVGHKGDIDASVDIINPENGTVDTVHMTAE